MGWSDCGTDSKGRHIGYAYEAICDHEGCDKQIHRGLSYACGDMHGDDELSCEKYFCEEHRMNFVDLYGREVRVCDKCKELLLESGECKEDEAGVIIIKEKTK